jgi:hypothetical protein
MILLRFDEGLVSQHSRRRKGALGLYFKDFPGVKTVESAIPDWLGLQGTLQISFLFLAVYIIYPSGPFL